MLSKRIVAIAADKAFARKLTAGLMAAGGTVETAAALGDLAKGEIQAELVCVHVPPGPSTLVKQVNERLRAEARLIVVIDKSSLEQVVDVMQAGRVSAVLIADELDPAVLSATATRLLWGDVFGLEKVVPWGVKIYSALVGDYQEKSVVISAVSDFATAMGVRRKYRESIEQVLDELLMNALYDAPVDAQGKQMFADVPTKTRISLRMEQKAIVQYTCEGDLFALSVRDAFGALDPQTVVKYLHKCLHAEQQIDRKAGGAGLGLYIIANAATQFLFNIMPGVATEVVCTFDLTAAKVQMKTFGMFTERIDSAGRLTAGPSKMVPSGRATSQMGIPALSAGPPVAAPASRGVTLALGAAIVLLLALIAIVAYPRFVVKTGSIAVSTDPPGALIEVDGRAVGTSGPTPLVVEDLQLSQKFKVTARVDGYEPEELIAAPGKQAVPVVMRLQPRKSIVLIDSDPQGATVIVGGVERGTTPATIDDWPAGSEQEVVLRRTGYSDLTRKVKVPGPGRDSAVQWSLTMSPDFASVRLESDPPGAQVLQNGELMAGLVTPVAEHIIQAGKSYTYTFKLPGHQPLSQTVNLEAGVRAQKVAGKLLPGGGLSVRPTLGDGVYVTIVGVPACTDKPAPLEDCPLAKGKYKVELKSDKLALRETIEVKMDAGDVVREVPLGIVEADGELMLKGPRRAVKRMAVPAGKRTVVVIDETGAETRKTVQVAPGATVKLGR